jgi:hypothetical protein
MVDRIEIDRRAEKDRREYEETTDLATGRKLQKQRVLEARKEAGFDYWAEPEWRLGKRVKRGLLSKPSD